MNMKVILLQDVAKIGRRSQIVEVPDGYARNQLIPKRLAEPASLANTRRIERAQAQVVATTEAGKASFDEAVTVLKDKIVKVAVEVNEKGHTFKAVSESDIAATVSESGTSVEASMILVSSPIKEVGIHEIQLVSGQNKAKFSIEVVSNK